MTLQELSRYYRLREQLGKDESILASLEASATSAVQVITGMPHAPGVKDKVGDLSVEIVDMRETIQLLRLDIEAEETRVVKFIDAVEDEYIRTILRLRFLRCLTWQETANVIGGKNSEEGIKTACYRFLRAIT